MPRPQGINKKSPSQPPVRNKRNTARSVLNGVLNSSTPMTHPSAASGRIMARAGTDPTRVTWRIPCKKTTLLSASHTCGRTTRNSVRRFGPVKKEMEGKEEKKALLFFFQFE